MSKTFYVTTPIYYPSDVLHIGHALTTTLADTLARYKRMQGYDVWFLTGSDEHGQKIQRKAQEKGVTPQEYVDPIVASFQKLWRELQISYNDFIRTTEPRHQATVQELLWRIYEKGDIYRANYRGWYCTPCETFWTERQLVEGNCPDCGRPVEMLEEESYFFRLGKYQDDLLRHIEAHPDFIQPPSRRNEMVSFIKSGLEDLCISRTTFDWGIQVPFDSRHVVYVWFDALTNYISALGWGTPDDHLFIKYWPEAVHLVGKDIVRFHTIIWPIMLMAAGLPLPKKVFGHGWLLVDGGKMSKSRGNVVDPLVLIERYGADAVRYFLLRELPYGGDGYYSEDALRTRYNTDLANDLGNLIHRSVTMIQKYCDGVVPAPGLAEGPDLELRQVALEVPEAVETQLERFDTAEALVAVWRLVARANKYVEETAPWNLARNGQKERLDTVMYNLAESLRLLGLVLAPFMPELPGRIFIQLGLESPAGGWRWEEAKAWGRFPAGTRVRPGQPLFPRLVDEEPPAAEIKTPPQPAPAEITIEQFQQVDLRVAKVVEAKPVPKTDRLLELRLDLGGEQRTVVAGIAAYYRPEDLVGKKVVVVANLKPATLRGITSRGMVLAAGAEGQLALLTVDGEIPAGAKIR